MVVCRLVSRCRSDTKDCRPARGRQLQPIMIPSEKVEGVWLEDSEGLRSLNAAGAFAGSIYWGVLQQWCQPEGQERKVNDVIQALCKKTFDRCNKHNKHVPLEMQTQMQMQTKTKTKT